MKTLLAILLTLTLIGCPAAVDVRKNPKETRAQLIDQWSEATVYSFTYKGHEYLVFRGTESIAVIEVTK